MASQHVDILIAAKNEARVIESTVRSFFKLDYEKFFLWVINDGCKRLIKLHPFWRCFKNEFANLRVINRAAGSSSWEIRSIE